MSEYFWILGRRIYACFLSLLAPKGPSRHSRGHISKPEIGLATERPKRLDQFDSNGDTLSE